MTPKPRGWTSTDLLLGLTTVLSWRTWVLVSAGRWGVIILFNLKVNYYWDYLFYCLGLTNDQFLSWKVCPYWMSHDRSSLGFSGSHFHALAPDGGKDRCSVVPRIGQGEARGHQGQSLGEAKDRPREGQGRWSKSAWSLWDVLNLT